MTSAHLHLLLNHFPIIGTLIGAILLAFGFLVKNHTLKIASAFVLVSMALIAIPLPSTGEAIEELVEKMPGVSEAAIEAHEDAATIAMWLMEITGIVALLALLLHFRKSAYVNAALIATLLLSAATFAAMARTGYLGGQIRHTEISSGPAIQAPNGEPAGGAAGEKDDD